MPKRLILHTTNSKGYALFLALLPIIMVYRRVCLLDYQPDDINRGFICCSCNYKKFFKN